MTLDTERISPESFTPCVEFVMGREASCVSLASHLSRGGRPFFDRDRLSRAYVARDLDANGSIEAVFVRLANGILLHCASDELLSATNSQSELATFARESLKGQGLRCIMGSGRGTLFMESLIAKKGTRAVDYVLMAREDINPPQQPKRRLPDAAEILHCSVGDADSLLPLQEGYEREEVVPPGEAFSKEQCRANLAKALTAQSVYAVRIGGRFVAKAGTNARGFAWDQLGGIYTAPEWRGQGLAQALVAELIRERSEHGKRLSLFAKVANEPAKRAYASAGFVSIGEYRITYY